MKAISKSAEGRRHGLGRQAALRDADEDIGESIEGVLLQGAGAVPEAKGIDPVKHHAGPAIPEIIGVKHGIDHRRGIPGFHPPEIFIFPHEIAQVEYRIRQGQAEIQEKSGDDPQKLGKANSLGGHDVIAILDHRCKLRSGVKLWSWRSRHAGFRVTAMEGEIAGLYLVVRGK